MGSWPTFAPLTPEGLAKLMKLHSPANRAAQHYMKGVAEAERKRRIRKYLLKRDGSDCFYCGDPLDTDKSIEHLIERSLGGSDDYGNLRLVHQRCNQSVMGLSHAQKMAKRTKMLKRRGVRPRRDI